MLRLLITLLICSSAFAEIITSDRRVDWAGNVGIPGGIPNRSTVFTTVSVDTSGTADASGAIQSAINGCPSNQVVMLPAGFIRINNPIYMRDGVVLRGQGMTNTVLRHYNIYGVRFNEDFGFELDQQVTSGFTHGSTSLTLANAGSYAPGMIVCIDQNNDAAMGVNMAGSEGGPLGGPAPGNPSGVRLYDRAAGHYVEITGKSGNTVTVTPPLAYTFSSPFVPKLHAEVISGTKTHIRMAGLENLTLTNTGSFNSQNDGVSVFLRRAAYCWVKNVETEKSHRRAVQIRFGYRNQIEGCTFANTIVAGSDQGYGVQLDFWSSCNLVQNNIANKMLNCVALEYASCYNAFAYNFYTNGTFRTDAADSPEWMPGGFSGHAGHFAFNLFEGNVGDQSAMDFIHGSGSHTTWLRNHFRGQRLDKTSNERGIQCHAWQRYHNAVGNVLGNNLWTAANAYESYPGGTFYNDAQPVIYWLGWFAVFNANPSDTLVRSTMLRHGNWDAVTQSTIWQSGIADHVIPSSYIYPAKPLYWGESYPWPAMGSDLSPMLGTIPAQRRFLGMVEGGGSAPEYNIIVATSNPIAGVGITVTPPDNNGNGSGTTQFTRTYNDGAQFTLVAPAMTGTKTFSKWQKNGIDFSSAQAITLTADSEYTVTAFFVDVAPAPIAPSKAFNVRIKR